MRKKKIIIFGSTGNVGSYLTDYVNNYFDKNEYEIIAVGRRKTNFFDKLGIKYFSVDISQKEDFKKLPKDNVFAVILLSATIPSYMKEYNPQKYLDSNIMGAFNVLEYCRTTNADRILYSQTVAEVILSVKDGVQLKPFTERKFSYKGDHTMYVISKNTALELIEHYHQEYGLKKFIFRFPTIYNYSPFHYYYPNGVKTIRPVYKMIESAMKSEPLEVWGNPKYSKDMVYVADCAQMFCKAIEVDRTQGFYNVGTGIPVTIEEQIQTIINVFSPKNNPSKIIYCPEKPIGGGFLMDITNAKEELGYEPKYSCKALFEEYKKEMQLNRFKELLEK